MLRAQLLRRAMEVFGKLPDRTEIAADRGRRVVAPLKLVEHALAKWGHGNLLPMTSHPSPASLPSLTTTLSPSRQRLRSNRHFGQAIQFANRIVSDKIHWTKPLRGTR